MVCAEGIGSRCLRYDLQEATSQLQTPRLVLRPLSHRNVSCIGLEPSEFAFQTSSAPVRPEKKTTRRPSGDSCASWSAEVEAISFVGSPGIALPLMTRRSPCRITRVTDCLLQSNDRVQRFDEYFSEGPTVAVVCTIHKIRMEKGNNPKLREHGTYSPFLTRQCDLTLQVASGLEVL